MTIKNKHNGIIIQNVNTGFRKGKKIVKFSGVSLTIGSNSFNKHWEIVPEPIRSSFMPVRS